MLHRLLFDDPFFGSFRRPQAPRRLLRPSRLHRSARPQGPALDIYAKDSEVLVRAELPGVTAEALALDVHGDTLTLRGHRADPIQAQEGDDDTPRPLHRERATGEFVRTLKLPFAVDSTRAEARLKHGVLEVRLHRPEADQPKRIEISTAE